MNIALSYDEGLPSGVNSGEQPEMLEKIDTLEVIATDRYST
jgi:hypothetical protein